MYAAVPAKVLDQPGYGDSPNRPAAFQHFDLDLVTDVEAEFFGNDFRHHHAGAAHWNLLQVAVEQAMQFAAFGDAGNAEVSRPLPRCAGGRRPRETVRR